MKKQFFGIGTQIFYDGPSVGAPK